MTDLPDPVQSAHLPCPRCGEPVPTGADECPSCEQSLCPACGAAVGQHWPSCMECGATWDLLCPECEAVVRPRHRKCPQCGASIEGEAEPLPQEPAPPPPPPVITSATFGTSGPVCEVCGRQDESLRLAAFPWVVSLLFITFRRAFGGLWCRRHRNRYRFLAGLISPLVGWFGIPFGFIYTPMALLQMAGGGIQPRDENQRLLQVLSGHKLRAGEPEGAIRCLEQALRLNDDEPSRQRLGALYDEYRPSTHRESSSRFWPYLIALLGALALGVAIGLVDSGIESVFRAIFGTEVDLLIAILSWMPWITLLFLGGLALVQILQWALTRGAGRQMALGSALAVLSTIVLLYGTQQGYALAYLVQEGQSVVLMGSPLQDLLYSWFAWTAGGAINLFDQVRYGGGVGLVYLVVFVVASGYYLVVSLRAAREIVRWQQALAVVRSRGVPSPARALQPGWLAVALIFVCIACSLVSAPLSVFLGGVVADGDRLQEVVLLDEQGRSDDALAEMEALVEERPGVGPFHWALGGLYSARGDHERAAEQFEKAVALNPEDALAHASLAFTYHLQDQEVRAKEELAQAETFGADNGMAQRMIGHVYIAMHDMGRAEERLLRATELVPDEPSVHLSLATAYSLQDKHEEALDRIDRTLELDPSNASAYRTRAYVYLRQEDFERGREALDQGLELSRDDSSLHSALSLWHYLQGDHAAARQEAQEALSINRYDQDAYLHLALACQAEGDLEPALAAAGEALRLYPKDDMVYYALGLCYRDLGQETEAAQAFEAFLDLYWDRAYIREWKAEAEAYVAAHQ